MGTFSNDNTQQKKKKSSAIHLDSVSTRYSGNIADVLEKARSSNITLGEEARSENVKIGDADGTKKKGSSSRKNAKPKSNQSSNKNAPSFKRTLNNEIRHKNNEIQIIKSQIETIEKTSGSYGELQKLNQKLEKAEKEVQNLYEMREKLTPHFDKQDHVKELKQQLEHVRQLADETSKKLDQIRESDNPDLKEYTRLFDLERKQLDKVERLSERFERTQARPESFVSATRRISSKAQDKIRNPVQKIIKNTRLYKTMNKIRSPFSKGVNKVRTTMQKGVRKAGGTVVDIFKRLIKFLFTTHIGRIITVVWLIFSIMISEVINTPPQTAENAGS